ncbi:MAG: gentisate 1,2-dioxygenase [Candidatus Acidiferrales bacterium]
MTSSARVTPAQASDARKAYYDRIAEHNLAPLWERISTLVTRSPQPAAQPVRWRFAAVRPHLIASGSLLSVEEAERRVLVLENPGIPGQSQITGSLYAGLQLLLPGERAGAHRHTASALRLILEGSRAYTAVDGERTPMARGDFIITPSWTWHDHGNDGADPVIWLDGLDVPIVNLFATSFFEHYEGDFPASRPALDCEARYGGALLPESAPPRSLSSPLLNYRYERARETLATLYRNGPVDPCHGVKLRYANPLTGGPVMPTMSAAIQLIPAGFETAPYRSTDGTVFLVIEGKGRSHVGETSFDWAENDIFVVPSWAPQQHAAEKEAVLFSFSDRVAQEKLGIWREQRDKNSA